MMTWMRLVAVLLAMLVPCAGIAQTKPPIQITAEGAKVDWRVSASTAGSIDMSQLKGKVVLFYYWSTDCAVCLDKMAELRENVMGWKNRPFVLIAVNVDRRREDFDTYAKISKTILGNDAQCVLAYHKDVSMDSLWRKSRLPLSHIVDVNGHLKFTFSGRIPAQAWDDIAELVP